MRVKNGLYIKKSVAAVIFVKSLYSIKKLVDGTLERECTKASNASTWGSFYIKEVHEGAFKHVVLNYTINRGCLQKNLSDRCLHAALNTFLFGFFRALF